MAIKGDRSAPTATIVDHIATQAIKTLLVLHLVVILNLEHPFRTRQFFVGYNAVTIGIELIELRVLLQLFCHASFPTLKQTGTTPYPLFFSILP
jgi:hypothetical protein